MSQYSIPAVCMRGGSSKGVFFKTSDLPSDPHLRDQILLRVIGSPDPYEQQVDGEWRVTKALMSRSARRLMEGLCWCRCRLSKTDNGCACKFPRDLI